MKMWLKMKNKSYRYDINRPRTRQGNKYTKYKTSLGRAMVICIKDSLKAFHDLKNRKNSV